MNLEWVKTKCIWDKDDPFIFLLKEGGGGGGGWRLEDFENQIGGAQAGNKFPQSANYINPLQHLSDMDS